MLSVAEILTSHRPPRKTCLMGNEAVARAAIESGVRGVFAYPGTPSTEISEVFSHVRRFQTDPDRTEQYPALTTDPVYFEYSVNEKIAVEKAIAYTLGNRSSMCCMKSAGLNVALDPLMTIPYQTIGQPLVVIVCDDPGCFSSTTEQDSRHFGKIASLPVFNPAAPQDAYEMVRDAFDLSGRLKLPVLVRMTTRVSHSRGIVSICEISSREQEPAFTKSAQHLNIPSRTASAHRALLDKLDGEEIRESLQRHTVERSGNSSRNRPELAVITCGVAASYAAELIARHKLAERLDVLKIGITHPFPERDVAGFLKNGYRRVLVLEELDPVVENEIRILSDKRKLKVEILGKGFAGLTAVGEYSLDVVRQALSDFTGARLPGPDLIPAEARDAFLKAIPPRPPAMCPGCSHRATFYALKLAVHPAPADLVLCGDIGCFAMGAFAPFEMIDTIHHMGMSISMAQGLAEAFQVESANRPHHSSESWNPEKPRITGVSLDSSFRWNDADGRRGNDADGGRGYDKDNGNKTIALLGDGTMFHSGIASLLNAVYSGANVMIVVFDNRTIGMTGHQPHPGSSFPGIPHQVDLQALALAMGVEYAETVDPNDIARCYEVMLEAWDCRGVSVVVSKSPCVFLPEFKDSVALNRRIEVDPARCNTCDNQEDGALVCSRCGTPESNILKARAKLTAEIKIPAPEQRCPANICNHGFFAALATGAYNEAIRIVRDKTLFVRVCGDICPRPCEYLYRQEGAPVVPIRRLKRYVAESDDFSLDGSQIHSRISNGMKVAVVGAGPAGLSAAYDLVRCGYGVTVFEREQAPGGLLKSVIPDFRVDKAEYDREVNILHDLGVEFEFGKSLGGNVDLNGLSEDYNAVVLAIGMGDSLPLRAVEESVPEDRHSDAITFLQEYNRGRPSFEAGSSVIVVGGGNSAIDSARAALRTQAADVIIHYRRGRADMPAFREEIDEALAEGVRIVFDSVVTGCSSQPDGRLKVELKSFRNDRPTGSELCDYIITAVGQRGREEILTPYELQLDDGKRVVSDPRTGRVLQRNVFVAGDICAGTHVSLIGAIAGGKKAANGVRALLEGYPYAYEGGMALESLNDHPRSGYTGDDGAPIADFEDFRREISQYYMSQSCRKCNHCIENFGCPALVMVKGKVVIDDAQCTRCGQCIDVCINDAIHWAHVPEGAAVGKRNATITVDG